ncbi:MAG: acyl carrier protein [Bacilli bacterium]|nr:acyl carrier protein [Bacilli bacterium]
MLKKIKEIIAEQLWLKTNKIELDSKLERNLGADSLDMVEIVSRIEDEFSIEIPDEEFYSWKTVKDIMNYLEEHV